VTRFGQNCHPLPVVLALLAGAYLRVGSVAAAGPGAAVSSVGTPSSSTGTSVSATNTLIGEARTDNRNRNDNDDSYNVLINRLTLVGTDGDLTANVRLDGIAFRERPRVAGSTSGYRDDARIERLSVQARLGLLRATVGDFYRQLGRGIVLAVRKGDDNGVDLAIRGVELHYGSARHQLSGFAGRLNPANVDSVSQRFVNNTNDLIAGAAYEYSGLSGATIGLYGTHLRPDEQLVAGYQDRTSSGGAFVEMPAVREWLSLYAELDTQVQQLAGRPSQARAAYATADIHVADTTVLLEGLYLDGFEQLGSNNLATGARLQVNRPPTLERIEDEVLNSREVLGGRLRFEQYVPDLDLLLFVNGVLRLNDFRDAHPLNQLHGHGGLELFYDHGRSRLGVSGGYRQERQRGKRIKTMTHVELDCLQALPRRLALHLTSVNELRTLRTVGGHNGFARGSTFFALQRAGTGELTFELGYDNQDNSGDVRNLFYAGILTWQARDALRVRATLGTQRGGIKCVSGVCRIYPAFAGARVEIVGRF
jgi:hypothetical protein